METACSPVMYNSSLGDWVIPCYFLEVSQHHSGLLKALLMFKYLEYVKHHRSCWRYWTKCVRETNWRSGFHLPHMVTCNSWTAELSLMSLRYQRETRLFGCLIRKDNKKVKCACGKEEKLREKEGIKVYLWFTFPLSPKIILSQVQITGRLDNSEICPKTSLLHPNPLPLKLVLPSKLPYPAAKYPCI